MGLEDDLKARTSALISQQMANWVVEIQRAIQGHQATLVSALDELGETVARYDEKVDESSIAGAISEVLAQQPPAAAAADYSGLKASIAAIEKGTNLSEVLTNLMGEVMRHAERAAMFIVKNNAAVGWNARGFDHPEAVKAVTIPLTADTIFRIVHGSRSATRGHVSQSPATSQALARLGGGTQGMIAVPLILRDKVAAILYCDTTQQEEVPAGTADVVEIMVAFSAKVIDVLSAAPKTAGTAGGTSPGMRPTAPAPPVPEMGSSSSGFGRALGARPAPAAAPAPAPPPAAPAPKPATAPPLRPAAFTPAPAAPAAPARSALSGEDQKAHEDAKRFARLVVSEIKLYNEAKVTEGRKTKDIYERLKEDIERGRQMYMDRVPAPVRDASDYFQDELVRILAGGDVGALGPQ